MADQSFNYTMAFGICGEIEVDVGFVMVVSETFGYPCCYQHAEVSYGACHGAPAVAAIAVVNLDLEILRFVTNHDAVLLKRDDELSVTEQDLKHQILFAKEFVTNTLKKAEIPQITPRSFVIPSGGDLLRDQFRYCLQPPPSFVSLRDELVTQRGARGPPYSTNNTPERPSFKGRTGVDAYC